MFAMSSRVRIQQHEICPLANSHGPECLIQMKKLSWIEGCRLQRRSWRHSALDHLGKFVMNTEACSSHRLLPRCQDPLRPCRGVTTLASCAKFLRMSTTS